MDSNPSPLTSAKSSDKSVFLEHEPMGGNSGFSGQGLDSTTKSVSDVRTPMVQAIAAKISVAEAPPSMPLSNSPIGGSNPTVSRPFVPSLGVWAKPPVIIPDIVSSEAPSSMAALLSLGKGKSSSGKPPPEIKPDGTLRFPWAAKMDPSIRNLYRTTSPSYMEDGTHKVHIPNHVLMQGLKNQKEYIIGQFYRCYTPSGGLIHAVTNRLWGRKCKVSTRKLGESSYLFHIPDKATREWVLQRGLWHIDDCIMFVAPWTPAATLAMPEITTVPVWVTLKNIPSRLYSFEAISWIASGLGEPMVTNKPWLDPTQIGEAKLMVEVELEKGFPDRIAAEDKRGNVSLVDVEYSWLPTKCKKYGQLGHKESRCLLRSGSAQTGLDHVSVSIAPTSAKVSASAEPPSTIIVATDFTCPETIQFNGNTPEVIESAVLKESTVQCESLVVLLVLVTPTATTQVESPIAPATIESNNLVSSLVDVTVSDAGSPLKASLNRESDLTFSVQSAQETCHNSSQPCSESAMIFGSNQFAALGDYAGFDIGDSSTTKTRGGRTVKPSQKMQDMHWTIISGCGNRGRGGRGSRGTPY